MCVRAHTHIIVGVLDQSELYWYSKGLVYLNFWTFEPYLHFCRFHNPSVSRLPGNALMEEGR